MKSSTLISKQNTTKIHISIFKGCVCYIFAILFLSLKQSTCETRKNVFYFTLKALFFFKKNCQKWQPYILATFSILILIAVNGNKA